MVYDNVPNDLIVSIDRWGPSKSSAGQTGLTQDCQDHPRSTRVGKSCKTWKKQRPCMNNQLTHFDISDFYSTTTLRQRYVQIKLSHFPYVNATEILEKQIPTFTLTACIDISGQRAFLSLWKCDKPTSPAPAPRWSFSAELREGKTDPATTFH